MTNPSLMHETGHPKLVHWDNSEERNGKGCGREVEGGVQDGGTHVHAWMIHVDVWQKLPQYCKVISFN